MVNAIRKAVSTIRKAVYGTLGGWVRLSLRAASYRLANERATDTVLPRVVERVAGGWRASTLVSHVSTIKASNVGTWCPRLSRGVATLGNVCTAVRKRRLESNYWVYEDLLGLLKRVDKFTISLQSW